MWILYYPVLFYLAYLIFTHANEAIVHYQAAVEKLDLASQTELAFKSFLENLSLNLYEGASEIRTEIDFLKQQAQTNLQQADLYSILFAIATLLFIAYLFYLRKLNKQSSDPIIIHIILIAFVCLMIGISTPMLNLIAFKDLPVLGTVIFKYESKGILSVIQTLWQQQQYFISALLMLFSLLLPLAKLLCSSLILLIKDKNIKDLLDKLIHGIGKWSMTDVFVIAILLAFFTMNVDETTNAWLGHGLYFFAAYSLLSLWAGILISKELANSGDD